MESHVPIHRGRTPEGASQTDGSGGEDGRAAVDMGVVAASEHLPSSWFRNYGPLPRDLTANQRAVFADQFDALESQAGLVAIFSTSSHGSTTVVVIATAVIISTTCSVGGRGVPPTAG